GKVKQQQPGRDFPADSYFDVNVEVSLNVLPQVVFVNLEPIRMQSVIWSLPPHAFAYLPPPGTCTPLAIKGTPVPVLWMIHAEHLPETNRWCGIGSGGGLIRDVNNGFVGPWSFQAALSIVFGLPSNNTLGDMIDLDLNGPWVNFQRPRPVVVDERANTGSPGTMVGEPPQIPSSFDVFAEVSLDGLSQTGTPRFPFQGFINPTPGAMSGLQLTSTVKAGPMEFLAIHMDVTTVPCTSPYPPMDP
ncbi:MAG: hypothetical protein ACRD2A_14185, partial [Vicinamibacterales bacterium]